MKNKALPLLPLLALGFYFLMYLLGNLNVIPFPAEILDYMTSLYADSNWLLFALFVFFEGIVFLGLYLPGTSFLVYSLTVTDGGVYSFFVISSLTAILMSVAASINYSVGHCLKNKISFDPNLSGKQLFWTCIHPNVLGFYAFNEGLGMKGFKQFVHVPLYAFFFGFLYTFAFFYLSPLIGFRLERVVVVLFFLLLWFLVDWFKE
ncbi:MAG: hypothetical protein ACI83O_000311 [Patescibacteria group bacterium]|jgi:hypothetical protein